MFIRQYSAQDFESVWILAPVRVGLTPSSRSYHSLLHSFVYFLLDLYRLANPQSHSTTLTYTFRAAQAWLFATSLFH